MAPDSPSSTPPSSVGRFTKPPLTLDQHVALLRERGLVISDESAPRTILEHVGYYRFSGYTRAFYRPDEERFADGVTIEQVDRAYRFDQRLQNLIWNALSYLEIDIRGAVVRRLAEADPFAYARPDQHPDLFHSHTVDRHAGWLGDLRRDASSHHSPITDHFRASYPEEEDLPIWMAVEVMTFGRLSKLIGLLDKRVVRDIGQRYGFQWQAFRSSVRLLSYVRNVCAHHSRLWDRRLQFAATLPRGDIFDRTDGDRAFAVVLLLLKMLSQLSHRRNFYYEWGTEVRTLLFDPPRVADPAACLGLPDRWQAAKLWPRESAAAPQSQPRA